MAAALREAIEAVRIPVPGDADFWQWHRADDAFAGWSDYEVMGTIWPTDHPGRAQAMAQFEEKEPGQS